VTFNLVAEDRQHLGITHSQITHALRQGRR
jgi:hypothetical protein